VELLTTVAALRDWVRQARAGANTIGLVPTMGALHTGHLSLIERARAECDRVIVTLFVNPTQFGAGEDLGRYPRDLQGDRAAAASAGAHLMFAPPPDAVYPPGFATWVTVDGLTEGLCGASRPTHFRGVATVVAKLFNMTQPDRAYFGEKDFQQLQVVRRLTQDLNLPIEIVGCPIVRDPDGLAISSRNRYLTAEQRRASLALPRALAAARERYGAGERSHEALVGAAQAVLAAEPDLRIDYLELVEEETLRAAVDLHGGAVLAAAIFVGSTRLIDNARLG
jgi:pantoate--beta-alanine ligase